MKNKFQKEVEENQKRLEESYRKYIKVHPLELEEAKQWKRA